LFEKENACKRKANEPFPLDTRNAAPQYLLAALNQLLGTFARKRAGA
jgi:hypothetical protein